MVIETRRTPRKLPGIKRWDSTESDYYEEFEKKLMVKTRRTPKAPVESPQKNGLSDIMEDGVDEEVMEIDTPAKVINGKRKSFDSTEKTPRSSKKAPKTEIPKENKTMKEHQEEKNPKPVEQKDTEDNSKFLQGSSMAVLLTQGLMAHDNEKVDSVLRVYNHHTIQGTMNELNIAHVIPLLKAIEHRLRHRISHDISGWLRWLQYTLSRHMSFLASQRVLDKEVSGLLDWLKGRAMHQQKLYQLQGKLGILVDQIERRNKTASSSNPQPMIIFNNDEVQDSDEEELESIASDESGASSEEDWWDDGEIRQDEDDEDEDDEEEDEELEELQGGIQIGEDSDDEDNGEEDEEGDEMEED